MTIKFCDRNNFFSFIRYFGIRHCTAKRCWEMASLIFFITKSCFFDKKEHFIECKDNFVKKKKKYSDQDWMEALHVPSQFFKDRFKPCLRKKKIQDFFSRVKLWKIFQKYLRTNKKSAKSVGNKNSQGPFLVNLFYHKTSSVGFFGIKFQT